MKFDKDCVYTCMDRPPCVKSLVSSGLAARDVTSFAGWMLVASWQTQWKFCVYLMEVQGRGPALLHLSHAFLFHQLSKNRVTHVHEMLRRDIGDTALWCLFLLKCENTCWREQPCATGPS
jgi:hypothetical protein